MSKTSQTSKKHNGAKRFKTAVAAAILCAAFSANAVMPVSAASQYVEITGNSVNVRSDAGAAYPAVGRVRKGEQYDYLTEKAGTNGVRWFYVQLSPTQKGWITAKYAKLMTREDTAATSASTTQSTTATTAPTAADGTKLVEITGASVNVRSGAGKSASKVGVAFKGKQYPYLASQTNASGQVWYKIQFTANKTGWVVASLSKLTAAASTTAATTVKTISTTKATAAASTTQTADTAKLVEIIGSTVNVRSGAGKTASKVGVTAKGKQYPYLASKTDTSGQVWYQIQFTAHQTGWVMGSLSKLTAAASTTAKTTAKTTSATKTTTTAKATTTAKTTSTAKTTTTAKTTAKTASGAKLVEITQSPVNVRSGASQSAAKIGSAVKGQTYSYLASKTNASGQVWYQIQFTAHQTGWVMGSLSKLTAAPSTTTAKTTVKTTASATAKTTSAVKAASAVKLVEITQSPVNVRSGASQSAAKIGSTVKGQKYPYLASKTDASGQVWYKIQFSSNQTGWVMGSLSKLTNR